MQCFNEMLRLVSRIPTIHVSKFFVEHLEKVIDSKSDVVNDFLNQSFVVTEQFDDPVILVTKRDQTQMIISSDTTFLNKEKLQELVKSTWP